MYSGLERYHKINKNISLLLQVVICNIEGNCICQFTTYPHTKNSSRKIKKKTREVSVAIEHLL